ncbi:MAG TPA: hypothetical protein VKP65_08265 [Rhodothermales bacterium]|nr:hypothetical protein [Rhodothermales bacterium]
MPGAFKQVNHPPDDELEDAILEHVAVDPSSFYTWWDLQEAFGWTDKTLKKILQRLALKNFIRVLRTFVRKGTLSVKICDFCSFAQVPLQSAASSGSVSFDCTPFKTT